MDVKFTNGYITTSSITVGDTAFIPVEGKEVDACLHAMQIGIGAAEHALMALEAAGYKIMRVTDRKGIKQVK